MEKRYIDKIIGYDVPLSDTDKAKKIDQLSISFNCKKELIYKFHITTLGELMNIKTSKLKKEISNYNHLRRDLYFKENIVLKDDIKQYENANIDLDVALLPIMSLSISKPIVRKLLNADSYFFLGDLIITDYEELEEIKGLGEKSFKEIKDYIHSLGYKIKNEKETWKEISEKLNNQNIETIDRTYKIDPSILEILFQNNIYTEEDFINCGVGVFYLPGMTSLYRGRLLEIIHENNIVLDNSITNDEMNTANKKIAKHLSGINNKIKERINKKESLVDQLMNLKKEKDRLIKEEAQIDKKLYDIINTINNKYNIKEKDHGRK